MSTTQKQLTPGELSVGMFVTVLENQKIVRTEITGGVFVEAKVGTDRSGYGKIHTILAIDLPYIAVRRESPYETSRFEHEVDTRTTRLMELSKDYVLALCPYLCEKVKKQ